ncbi:MAG: hypothetical protein ACLQPH_05945 [Acidimicrobiales bacterium]
MSSAERRKGSQFERDVVAFLRANGHPYAERAYGAGRPDDRGDVDGIPGWTLELKNCQRLDLAGWCSEASSEAANARRPRWSVIFKRRNRPTADAYVLLDLATFAELLSEETP